MLWEIYGKGRHSGKTGFWTSILYIQVSEFDLSPKSNTASCWCQLWGQQLMVQVLSSLPPSWEAWVEFQASSFCLTLSVLLQSLERNCRREIPVCVLVVQSSNWKKNLFNDTDIWSRLYIKSLQTVGRWVFIEYDMDL